MLQISLSPMRKRLSANKSVDMFIWNNRVYRKVCRNKHFVRLLIRESIGIDGGHFILSIRVLKDEQNVYFYILFYILNSLPVLRWRPLFDTKSVNI